MDNLTQDNITNREKDVLLLTIRGLSNHQIARTLSISIHTVKAHLESIYRKFRVHNKVQASIYAVHNKFISIDEVF